MSEFETPYRSYDVLDKWDTPSWNDQTRAVVRERMQEVPDRRFLSEEEWMLLEAVAARIIPQPDRDEPIPIVPWIDEMLLNNSGPGYRYEGMPRLREAWRRGIACVEAESRAVHGTEFAKLSGEQQDALLRSIQSGKVASDEWRELPPKGIFKMLLKRIVTIYYAHPAGWSEIGFGGPASPRGYARLGFNERDPWEAKAEW